MSHPNQQWFVLDFLTGMDSQRHHQIGRISGINGIGSDDLSREPHLIFGHFGKVVHAPMNPSPSNASRPRGPGIAARHASRATPSRPGRRRPAPGRLIGMRRLTKPRPRRRPRRSAPLRVQHAHGIPVGMGLAKALLHRGSVGLCKASTSSGSSPATEAVCGHHVPSMSPPREGG